MKLKILLIAAFMSATLICEGQDQPAAPPQPAPAAPTPEAAPAASAQAPAPSASPSAPAAGQTAPPAGAANDAAAAPLAAGKLADSYVIGANDQIGVSVWKEPTFSGVHTVRPDGVITIPLVGDMMAAGLTPTDLGSRIMVKLQKYLQDPVVTISVLAIKSKVVFIMGEGAMKKGPMEMTPGMTVLQAMAMAGISEEGNPKKAYMLRDENGVRTKIPIHYKQALKGSAQDDFPLKPGDTIVIP